MHCTIEFLFQLPRGRRLTLCVEYRGILSTEKYRIARSLLSQRARLS